MSWTETRDRYRMLRAVEAALDLTPTAPLPWHAGYAELFGSPDRLRLALLARWRTIVQAQSQDTPVEELAAAHPGLARLAGLRIPEILSAAS